MFRLVLILLVLHSLLILNNLRTPPPNIFTALGIPINTPTDAIRATLQHSAGSYLPEYVNKLLDRLGSFERRSLYVRFGHNDVLTCDHCQTIEDYAFYAIPRPALAYLREIALIGLVTLEKLNRSHLRSLGVGVLVSAFFAEAFCLGTAPIAVPPSGTRMHIKDTYMWHDKLWLYRQLLFLNLPVLLFFLPWTLGFITNSRILFSIFIRIPFVSSFIKPPLRLASLTEADGMSPAQVKSFLIQSSLKTLDHLIPSIHLEKLTHAALMRDRDLRARASKWWDREKDESDVILNDEGVKRVARAEDLAFEEEATKEETTDIDGDHSEGGKLRMSARIAVQGLVKQGLGPSEHWVQ